jgi:uncharacterized protein (DUF1810 family)
MNDCYGLRRFLEAQDPVYQQVCSELEQGLKLTHWIWFIFPQMEGLSSSTNSKRFAIASIEEAAAYLDHPVLGPRLIHCTNLVTDRSGRTIKRILGHTDSIKFRSSMTLFSIATSENEPFTNALRKFFDGRYDPFTLERLLVDV